MQQEPLRMKLLHTSNNWKLVNVGNITQSNNGRTRLTEMTKRK